MASSLLAVTYSSDVVLASSKEFLDIQVFIVWEFTGKHIPDTIRTYKQMHRIDNSSQHSSVIWPVWLSIPDTIRTYKQMHCIVTPHNTDQAIWPLRLNGWVFVYELNGWGFECLCSHLIFRYCASIEQGVPWHSGIYRGWNHYQTGMRHDKNL